MRFPGRFGLPLTLTLRDLVQDFDRDLLQSVYERLLVPNFRADELVELVSLEQSCKLDIDGAFGVVVLDEWDEPVATMLADYFANARVLLLSYVAVDASWRGRGICSALIGGLLPDWIGECHPLLTVAEVDDPRLHQADRYGDPIARLRLYERLGARLIPLSYVQPTVRGEGAPVYGMLLLALPGGERPISTETVVVFLSEYYSESAGSSRVEDLRALRILVDELQARGGTVELMDIARYPEINPTG